MEKKIDNKNFEIIIIGIITLVFSLLFLWGVSQSPLNLMMASFITAPPIVVIAAKYDELPAVVVSTMVFAVVWAMFSLPVALIQLVSIGVIGLGVGYAFRKNYKLKQTMVFGGVSYAIVFILTNLISIRFYKTNLIQDVLINGIIVPSENFLVESFKNNEKEIIQLFNSILINIPAIITITSFVLGFVIMIISLVITRKAGYNLTSIEPFSEFRLPVSVVGISILAQLLSLGNIQNSDIDKATMVFLNITYILNFFFMVQGIALVDFFFKKLGLKGKLRIIVYFMGGIFITPFIFIPILPFILTITGILDALMDFRKLETK